jgi:hypothetical protein
VLGIRLWWRRGSSLAVLAVAVTAAVTAVVGPTYAAAASESSLRQVLRTAPSQDTGLHVQANADVTIDPFAPMARVLPAGFDPAYGTVVRTLLLPTALQGPGPVPQVVGHVVWRDGACAHLHVVAGRCPRGADEVMASARTGGPTWGVRVGATVSLSGLPHDEITSAAGGGFPVPTPAALRVVGLYVPQSVDDPFWFGHNYFGAHAGSGRIGDGPDTIDDVFVDRPAMDAASAGTTGLVWQDYFLDPTRVTRAHLGALRASVRHAQALFPLDTQPTLTTQLPAVLQRADRARTGLDSGTTLVTLQLLLLAWLVLFEVVAASSESRATEVAVAKLRGLRPRDVAVFGVAEPVTLVLAATPIGLALGWVAARALATAVLLPGVPVRLNGGSFVAAAIALVGGLVASALASRRILTRSVLDQWRRAEEHVARGRHLLAVDLALAALAVAAVAALYRHTGLQHHPSTLTLLGPALVVLAAALLGLRALPGLASAAAEATRAGRHLGAFLAARQVARRASEHRFAALLAVATGVAVFSVAANDVVHHNETRRARAEVGADRVLTVQPANGVDLTTAVRRADPDGRWAMAGAAWTPVGGSVGTTIQTLDTTRLQRVGYYDGRVEPLLAQLDAHSARGVTLSTTPIRVAVTAAGTVGHPALDVTVVDRAAHVVTIHGPVVRPGSTDVVVPLPCPSGCQLVGLALDRATDDTQTMRGRWSVTRLDERRGASWAAVDAQLSTPQAWRSGTHQTNGADIVTATPDGTTDSFVAEPGGWPSIELADVPRPLPVLLTVGATTTTETAPYVNDLAGGPVPLVRVATVPLVPRLLGTGGLADISAARASLPAFDQLSVQQVWLGRDAPKDALQRLRSAGLVLGAPDSVSQHVQSLRQQGPALALQLFLFASFACAGLALAATVLALAAAGRRRSFELAALLAVGVRRSALLRACVTEQIALLGAGLVLGVVPGLVAAGVTLSNVPEFVDVPPIPLSYVPSPLALALFIVGLSALVIVVAVIGAVLLLRAAVPSRLREAAP